MKKFVLSLLGVVCLSGGMVFSQASLSNTNPENPSSTTTVEEKTVTTHEVPSDFPVFENTGNPEADNAAYKAKKDAWIATHPEEYKALNQRRELTPAMQEEKNKKESNPIEK